ncbi:MAG: hypothetical protein GXP54_12770 [Deltaproteobacteria bacterium]|nr:hypothetical protein [Deltaproteobacteria bacterium]
MSKTLTTSRHPAAFGDLVGRVLVVLVIAAAGCGPRIQVRPSRLAAQRTEDLARSHEKDREFLVRWNPAQCDVPGFEVRLDGAWHRVFVEDLDDPESPAATAKTRLQKDGGENTGRLLVRGELTSRIREALNKSRYMVLEIIEICHLDGCPPQED